MSGRAQALGLISGLTASQRAWKPGISQPFLNTDQIQTYLKQGFLVLTDFYSPTDCQNMRDAMTKLTAAYDPSKDKAAVFETGEKQVTQDYFLESGDKIRYFLEAGAVDEQGKLQVAKEVAFNKVGHALHTLDPVFKRYTFEPRVAQIARDLGLQAPSIPQSMYIFKQPGIGGEVTPHQDSTFLKTDPLSTTGFWIPLQDCTTSNGCLEVLPASHTHGLINGHQMVRVVKDGVVDTEFLGEPGTYPDDEFVPAETPQGSLVMIQGEVVHRSAANTSDKSRHAYTFHAIDTHETTYDSRNWLKQYQPFPLL
eukprot:m.16916 g.16916  ORF g.16916 m.16916 type:complete len:310 (+) comp10626_c1_seq1:242-1171(+)